jgi:hypothetical protein
MTKLSITFQMPPLERERFEGLKRFGLLYILTKHMPIAKWGMSLDIASREKS